MAAIASIAGSGLVQWLQSIRKQQTAQAASGISAASGTGTAGAVATTASKSTTATPGVQKTKKPLGASDFLSKIQQTVTNTLQAAKASGSTKNPNQIVEDSIASLLKNIFSGKSPAANAPSTPATQQAFQSALQSAGITSQQFESDFKAAVQDAQNDLAHPLPTGTNLDVTG